MEIDEIIQLLRQRNEQIKQGRYSLDTVRDLHQFAKELKRHAREINQCCY